MGYRLVTLHKNRELFNDLIEAVASDLKINPLYVEKDYWVTYVLKNLANCSFVDTAIFKGGTSLSKAYKLIERFSEDIDLAVITKDQSANQIKNLLKKIESEILDENFTEIKDHPRTSKGSQFRKTLHKYPKIKMGNFGEADENIMLEINSFATPYPFSKKEIVSYIAEFLYKKSPKMVSEYALESFFVNVLDLRRTFCEKLSAVARASFENDADYAVLKGKIRHLYDIYFLAQSDEIVAFLKDDDFIKILKDVRIDDQNQFSNSWAKVKLHETEIFLDTSKSIKQIARYYENDFRDLVYSTNFPSIIEIEKSFKLIAALLQEKEL